MSNVGLYIHIPFCAKKCNYCNFYSICGTDELYKEYVQKIISEVRYWNKTTLYNSIIDTIYIGGGTPSVLGTELLQSLLTTITSELNVSSDAEITMEVNPNSVASLDLSSLKVCGLNRISMGLQSAKDDELKLLGRLHTAYDATKAIEQFGKSGINNFSLDVMLGIPLQTQESLAETLDFCIESGAEHISTYMLKIEKNTVFYENPNNLVFADEDMLADLYELTCKILENNEFRHYEISNFCKNEKISRHNMKYWMLKDYLGIGPSAHSLIGDNRFYYPSDINQFSFDKILFESKGKSPEEYIMLSLRTDTGFKFTKYNELFNLSVSPEFLEKARKFEKLGLTRVNDKSVTLTEKGYLVSNAVISELLNTEI